MDLTRMNQITMLVMNGNRGACKDDEERDLYDKIMKEKVWVAKEGIDLDLIHDIE